MEALAPLDRVNNQQTKIPPWPLETWQTCGGQRGGDSLASKIRGWVGRLPVTCGVQGSYGLPSAVPGLDLFETQLREQPV